MNQISIYWSIGDGYEFSRCDTKVEWLEAEWIIVEANVLSSVREHPCVL